MERKMFSLVATMAAPGDPNKVSETLAYKLQKGLDINKAIVGETSEDDETENGEYWHEVWSLYAISCIFQEVSDTMA